MMYHGMMCSLYSQDLNERRNAFSHDKYANFIDKIKRFQIEL